MLLFIFLYLTSFLLLAVHQRDIRFIWDTNPMYLDDAKEIISMERMMMMGDCFHSLGLDYPEYYLEYSSIKPNSMLQEYISQVREQVNVLLSTNSIRSNQ